MPRKRRAARRRRLPEITEGRLHHLRTGHSFVAIFGDGFADGPEGLAEAERVYRMIADAFLADWVEDEPGTRPWAWWAFDAPEPRRLNNGDLPHPCQHELTFGMPRYYVPEDHRGGLDYETEEDYLTRLGLLTADEQKQLNEQPLSEELST